MVGLTQALCGFQSSVASKALHHFDANFFRPIGLSYNGTSGKDVRSKYLKAWPYEVTVIRAAKQWPEENRQMLSSAIETLKPAFTVASLPGTSTSNPTAPTTSTTMQVSSGPSFPITNYLAPVSASSTNSITSANGTVLKAAGTASSIMQIPSSFTFMSGGAMAPQLQAIQVHPSTQHSSTSSESGPEISQAATCSTVTLPATIVTSSVPTSVAGHMMYPSPHAVMYASTPTLADGSLAVLNAFSQTPSGIQMVIGQQSTSGGSNLTELQVVNLEATHNSKDLLHHLINISFVVTEIEHSGATVQLKKLSALLQSTDRLNELRVELEFVSVHCQPIMNTLTSFEAQSFMAVDIYNKVSDLLSCLKSSGFPIATSSCKDAAKLEEYFVRTKQQVF
ncbi:SRF factor, partial [Polypterus senegalus]